VWEKFSTSEIEALMMSFNSFGIMRVVWKREKIQRGLLRSLRE
jgi:hypothetical protein